MVEIPRAQFSLDVITPADTGRVQAMRLAILTVVALMFAPVSFLVGVAMLMSPDLLQPVVRRVGRFLRPSKEALRKDAALLADPVRAEAIEIRARRAWWLCSRRGRGRHQDLALLLEAETGDLFVLGSCWPPPCERKDVVPANWVIYRDPEDHALMGTRPWGRCPAGSATIDDEALADYVGCARVIQLESLPAPLQALIRIGSGYR